MVDIKPWTHAEHVNPMPHGGFDVAHHIPILDHPAKEPTHAVSPSCCSLTTVLWKWNNKRIPFWAKCIGVRLSSPVFSLQLCQQRLRLLDVSGVKALREPAIDRGQEVVGFGTPTLLLPQVCQAHGGAQLQRFRLLVAGDV